MELIETMRGSTEVKIRVKVLAEDLEIQNIIVEEDEIILVTDL